MLDEAGRRTLYKSTECSYDKNNLTKTQQPRGRTTQSALRHVTFSLCCLFTWQPLISLSLLLTRGPIVPFKGFQLAKNKDEVSIVRVGGCFDGMSVGVAADDQSLISSAVCLSALAT